MVVRWFPRILPMMRPFTIAVEGNIGSGKTTFLKHFEATDKQILVATEPVRQWQDVRGHNLLQLMYQDAEKYGFVFQSYVQLTMLQKHLLNNIKQPVKMMERSLHSARYCFVENLCRQNIMREEQRVVLDEWFQWLHQQGALDVDLIIYLRSKPEVVHQRLLERARTEELQIPLTLLQNLHDLHEDWLIRRSFPLPAPVMVINANRSLEEMSQEYERCDTRVKEMVVAQA